MVRCSFAVSWGYFSCPCSSKEIISFCPLSADFPRKQILCDEGSKSGQSEAWGLYHMLLNLPLPLDKARQGNILEPVI